MPDRYGETPDPDDTPDDLWAAQERRKRAVDNCTMCDDDGYRGTVICDHTDRTEVAKRGIALVRAELDKAHQRRTAP